MTERNIVFLVLVVGIVFGLLGAMTGATPDPADMWVLGWMSNAR